MAATVFLRQRDTYLGTWGQQLWSGYFRSSVSMLAQSGLASRNGNAAQACARWGYVSAKDNGCENGPDWWTPTVTTDFK
jgi:hypothetical protein